MAKGSPELARARREEIITACARLYDRMGFKDVTIKEIAAFTTFTRPSIYNYFQTKEEIFLALFQREYEEWATELDALSPPAEGDTRLALAEQVARTLARRERLLKLLANNVSDMEMNSRMENLVEFKKAYGASIEAMRRCVGRFCPGMTPQAIDDFLFSFLPLVYGLYPYAVVNDRQKAAMEAAGAAYAHRSIYELAFMGIGLLLGVQQ